MQTMHPAEGDGSLSSQTFQAEYHPFAGPHQPQTTAPAMKIAKNARYGAAAQIGAGQAASQMVSNPHPLKKMAAALRVALRVAIYARYSTDGQKETSVEDQIQTCRETAERYGLTVSEDLIFSDAAITGAEKALSKREQYHALRRAVRAGQVDVIICDQSCRLARHATEAMGFFDELKSHQVRLLTADGFDSEQPTAQLVFGIKSVFSQFFLDETRHRVLRGMKGEFGRGSMVTAVPYGYEVDPEESARSGQCVWRIAPAEGEVVKEIFSSRKAGMSFNQIAAILNSRRVPTPRDRRGEKGLYWRATGIWRILQNPLYKGIYQVNFGQEQSQERLPSERLVMELALVGAADWDACQVKNRGRLSGSGASSDKGKRAPRSQYGGGKHPLAGVFRCGVCGATLSCHHAKADSGSFHCVQCEHATAAGIPGREPAYVSVKGVRVMLRWLLERVVTGEAVVRFRDKLRARLAGGRESELVAAREGLRKAERVKERLVRLLGDVGEDDAALEQQYARSREDILRLQALVADLETGLRELNEEAIRRQLAVDLSGVLDAFLADTQAPERTRSLLTRIFPRLILLGKPDRYTGIFEVAVRPGAFLAEASDTPSLGDDEHVLYLRLGTSGSRSPVWTVEEVPLPKLASLGVTPSVMAA